MLRNIINGSYTTEIYKIAADTKRGSVVVKNLTNKSADKASDVAVETYFLDFDFVPTGHQSDMEISDYTATADTVKANAFGVLVKPAVGSVWGTDQVVTTGFTAGDYAVAGTSADVGKLVKATTGKVSTYKYLGTYDDAGNTLYQFEIVYPKTV